MNSYVPRLIDDQIATLFGQLPALLLTGPRACGKTTTAARYATSVVHLDRPAEAAAFRDDPDEALAAQHPPVLLDEWQVAPDVLGAVKRAVDSVHAPGRYLLTGSVRDALSAPTWPGTGRVIWLRMFGLCMREMVGDLDGPGFLDRLATANLSSFSLPPEAPKLRDYVGLAIRGGYPEVALALEGRARIQSLRSYVEQLVTRDAEGLTGGRDPARLRRYFEVLALNTAGLASRSTVFNAAKIDAKTAAAYDRLLTNMFVVEDLPAWSTNRLARLAKRPKRYLVDPSLMAASLSLTEPDIFRDGQILSPNFQGLIVRIGVGSPEVGGQVQSRLATVRRG